MSIFSSLDVLDESENNHEAEKTHPASPNIFPDGTCYVPNQNKIEDYLNQIRSAIKSIHDFEFTSDDFTNFEKQCDGIPIDVKLSNLAGEFKSIVTYLLDRDAEIKRQKLWSMLE